MKVDERFWTWRRMRGEEEDGVGVERVLLEERESEGEEWFKKL